ncbi:hypothetical protein BN2127_JRS1_04504 [Bacillus cereus]|nr:hypothetical protein BN2127_JRS1_04504 [Bacillus cereus]
MKGLGQLVDGILVSGTATDVEKAKQEFKEDMKKSLDYKVNYVTTKKYIYQKEIINKTKQMMNLKLVLGNMQLLVIPMNLNY